MNSDLTLLSIAGGEIDSLPVYQFNNFICKKRNGLKLIDTFTQLL